MTGTPRTRPVCAFLSTDDLDGFFTYDRLTIPCFEELGWAVEEVPWRAEARGTVDWSRFAVVVIRTPWDYQSDPAAFMAVLERIDAATRLENSLALCRWNLEKTYLRDLEQRGVEIVPTLWRPPGAPLDPSVFAALDALDALDGRGPVAEIVVKPVLSANADRTHRLGRGDLPRSGQRPGQGFGQGFGQGSEQGSGQSLGQGLGQDSGQSSGAAWAAAAADLAGRAAMIQPFLPAIVTEGEYSVFVFDGVPSHAVLKTPGPGDFRVQEEHGGQIRTVTPEPALVAAGESVLAALEETPLYARADFVRHRGRFLLMELELIEPSLYFPYDPASPRRFAEATVRRAG